MTEYEAEIYNILLERGICTAKQISEFGDVPLTRIYETLKQMEKSGLVSVRETRPKKYKIISLDSLENLIKEKEKELEEEVEKSEKIFEEIKEKAPPLAKDHLKEDEESFWLIRGRNVGLGSENELIKNTQEKMLVFSGDLSWLPEQIDILKELSNRGVDIKLLYHKHRVREENLEMLKNINIKTNPWKNGYVRGKIIDDKKTILVFKVPKEGVKEEEHTGEPGTSKLFTYERLISSNPKFVKMMKNYFSYFWDKEN